METILASDASPKTVLNALLFLAHALLVPSVSPLIPLQTPADANQISYSSVALASTSSYVPSISTIKVITLAHCAPLTVALVLTSQEHARSVRVTQFSTI